MSRLLQQLWLWLFLVATLLMAVPALAQEEPPPEGEEGEEGDGKPASDVEEEKEGPLTPKRGKMLVRIEPMADGLVRNDEWAVVRVKVANGRESTTARIQIAETNVNEGDTVVFGRVIELPQGTVKEVDLYYKPGWNARSRRISFFPAGMQGGDIEFFTTTVADEHVTVGVLGDDAMGMPIVQQTWKRPVAGPIPRPFAEDPRSVRVGLIPLANMPTRSTGYASLDWMVWPEADPSRVSPEQLASLKTWVANGGHLLVSVSDKWQIVRGSPLHDLLPVRLTGVSDADTGPLLSALLAGSDTFTPQPPVGEQSPTPVAESELRQGESGRWADAIVTLEDGRPAWAVGTYGLGTVHVITASPSLAPLSSDISREQLWRRLLWLPAPEETGAVWLNNALAQNDDALALGADLGTAMRMHDWAFDSPMRSLNTYNYNMYGMPDAGWEAELRTTLSDMPGVAPLPLSWLIGFSLLYLMAIGPADYLILRALKRQPWTWITFPITIAVFSAAALIGTAMIKGNQAIAQRLEVVDILPGTDLWRGDTYLGLFTTRKTTVTVRGGAPDSLVTPLQESGFMNDARTSVTEGPGELQWDAETWTLAYANSRWVGPGKGTVTVVPDGDGLVVHSTLPFALEDAEVRAGSQTVALGTLNAGEKRTLRWTDDQGYGLQDSEPVVRHLLRYPDEGRAHLDVSGWGVVLGLVRGPVEELDIEGLAPESEAVTLIRAPFAMPTELDAFRGPDNYETPQITVFDGAYP